MSSTYYFGKSQTLEKFGALELPVFKVDNQLEWVINGMMKGWKNLQPQWYNFLYQTSVKHHSIIDAKSRYTYGKGWAVDSLGLGTTELIELKSFLKKIEKNKVTQRCILDRVIQGGFACEMIYDNALKRVMPYHVDFSYIRESKPEYDAKGQLKPPLYFYTSDWKAQRPKDNKDFVVFHPFDVNEKPDKSKRYLVYYKDYRPDLGAYPLPEYMGGLPYIQADAEVGNFVYNNVKQGFSAGYIINFFQDLNETQQGEIERALIDRKHGSENAGNPLAAFNKPGDQPVTVTPIAPNGQDDRYVQLNNQIRDEIFTAHGMSPILLGMNGSGGWSDQAAESFMVTENFKRSYAAPAQQIFNEFMNGVIAFNKLKGRAFLEHLEPAKPQVTESILTWFNNKQLVADFYGIELPKEVVTTVTETERQFSAIGLNDDDYEVLDSFEYNFESIEDAIQRTSEFRMAFADKTEKAILGALNDNPKLKPKEIAEIIGKSLKEVNAAIKSLNDQGLLEGKGITPEGEGELEEFITVYKYKKRSDISGPDKLPTTRDFCVKYIDLSKNRSFTIDDIQSLSVQEGYDVFRFRGGWYHNPNTDKNTPYCRHVWEARIVRLK
jgi:DNA-binding Lrp family transcriptional regulator